MTKQTRKYVALAGDPIDDGADAIKAFVLEATSAEEAYLLAQRLAKDLGIDVCACHDGTPVYPAVEVTHVSAKEYLQSKQQ